MQISHVINKILFVEKFGVFIIEFVKAPFCFQKCPVDKLL